MRRAYWLFLIAGLLAGACVLSPVEDLPSGRGNNGSPNGPDGDDGSGGGPTGEVPPVDVGGGEGGAGGVRTLAGGAAGDPAILR